MTVRTFRELLARRPFQPFRLVMAGGQADDVHQPQTAFLASTALVVGTEIAEDGIPDGFTIGSLGEIASVEP